MEQAPFLAGIHGHIPYYHYDIAIDRGSIGIDWDSLFKWAFVRDPFERFASSFEYARDTGALRKDEKFEAVCDVVSQLNPMQVVSAEIKDDEQAFVKEVPSGILMEGVLFNLFIPQFYFLVDSRMKVGPEIFRFENIKEDWKKVCDRIGVKEFKLPVLKKTERRKYYYTPRTKKIVAKFYAQDIELFYS